MNLLLLVLEPHHLLCAEKGIELCSQAQEEGEIWKRVLENEEHSLQISASNVQWCGRCL
jgi:hypothetical protein